MRSSVSLVLSSVILFSGSSFGESLEFSKSVVDAYKEGSTSAKAIMTMPDKTKHPTLVQLPANILIKNITKGSLVFVKKHSEVFEIANVSSGVDGSTRAEIKSTGLYIGPKKMRNKRKVVR